ncbi:MAG: NAD(P)/FAD-dependent oxidoreductase [Candidatus Diapherotrites archaeon]|nr:NAD(P)/FAD-dependent oxidoreductase [Candidatus Diapherotrites archaeon]
MMYDSSWDVIVVGAGPGGSKCAQEFAERGMKTLVIDRKQELGAPKRCGEGLSMRWIKITNQKPNPKWALQEIHGAILISPSGKRVEIDTRKTGQTGYIIERKMWEKELAAEAIRAGAKYMLKALVYDVIKEGEQVTGVKVKHEGKELELHSKLVIAADGVDSMVARYAGIKTSMPLTECDDGYQYEMAGVKLMDPHKMELYFGTDVAPRGYVWVFPKGNDTANVGVGIRGDLKKTAKEYLDEWIENNKEKFENASIIEVNAGVIPVTAAVEKKVTGGLMVIGDAARMVNPIHGGGIGSAMEAGMMAAEIGTKAIKEGDVSEERLKEYEEVWEETRGKEFKKILKVRQFFEKLNDEQMELIADAVDPETILELGHGKGLKTVLKIMVKKSPAAAKLAMSFLKNI